MMKTTSKTYKIKDSNGKTFSVAAKDRIDAIVQARKKTTAKHIYIVK